MNFEQARFNMVEQQVRTWEVLDQDALDQLSLVPREVFVPEAYRNLAYSDSEIPLGDGTVMLPPKIQAHALQALAPRRHEHVLEIGATTGYMAALMAGQAQQVCAITDSAARAERIRANLVRANVPNVMVDTGAGLAGMPALAPFDVILVSGAIDDVPQVLLSQLKTGGRLFAVVGDAPAMAAIRMTRLPDDQFRREVLFETQIPVLAAASHPARFSF